MKKTRGKKSRDSVPLKPSKTNKYTAKALGKCQKRILKSSGLDLVGYLLKTEPLYSCCKKHVPCTE
jgi:hypothetical protein